MRCHLDICNRPRRMNTERVWVGAPTTRNCRPRIAIQSRYFLVSCQSVIAAVTRMCAHSISLNPHRHLHPPSTHLLHAKRLVLVVLSRPVTESGRRLGLYGDADGCIGATRVMAYTRVRCCWHVCQTSFEREAECCSVQRRKIFIFAQTPFSSFLRFKRDSNS